MSSTEASARESPATANGGTAAAPVWPPSGSTSSTTGIGPAGAAAASAACSPPRCASSSASACAASLAASAASSATSRLDTTSVTRSPNSSSITTTSPRAIGLPFTSRSTGSPASRLSDTTEPGRSSRVWPIVIRVRPISTASSTGTSCRRWRSAPSAPSEAPCWSGMNSISSCTFDSLLDGDVREQDRVGLNVGSSPDLLEHLALERRPLAAARQVVARRVGDRVGDDVADRWLLLERAEALHGRGTALGGATLRHLARRKHERDAQLREVAVGEVDQELLREHVDLAVDLRLVVVAGLGEHPLVQA